MKNVIVFLLVFFAVVMVAIQACDKNDIESVEPNQPPVAKAGNDIYLSLTSCDPKVNISLDGRSSFDPEHYSLTYLWRQVSGPHQALARIDCTRETL